VTTVAVRPPPSSPASEVHVWRVELDGAGWQDAAALPSAERARAVRIVSPVRRQRWIASRWALRTVLGAYLEQGPAAVELRIEPRGKPRLASDSRLRFNLSHSSDLALVAVTLDREVGVDVQRIGDRSPGFYEAWVRREAVVKCLGSGLGRPLPRGAVAVSALDAGPGFMAALATSGSQATPARSFELRPDA
jgi:4'-phosphopantetheinyl transferase